MGSSESKMPAAIKPEPAVKKSHISHLIDPRSPSTGIDRTPIQVSRLVSLENASAFSDPRSPTVGVSRTPVRDVMTGATSSTVLAEVHHEGSSFTEPSVEVEPLQDPVEHSYALPAVSVEPESAEASVPSAEDGSPAPSEEPEPEPASADATEPAEEPQPPCSSAVPDLQEAVPGSSATPHPVVVTLDAVS
uniref:Cell division cycle associated 3 n=1 Tax=Acanthochromis polyacanthus TaxID=80966 RepID=A0A3Q1GUV8_9TELE